MSIIGPETLRSPAKTDEMVTLLNHEEKLVVEQGGDPQWSYTYRADHGPQWSRIAVFDVEGFMLGYL